jgi:F-type H+-transporting ATPase subunit b
MGNIILLSASQEAETLQLFSIDFGTVIFTWINTLILVLLFRFFLYAPVMRMLEKRKEAVNTEINAASEAKEKAEKTEKEYLSLLANSKEEAQKIVSAATAKAHEREEEIIAEAKNSAAQIHKKAEEDIERERQRAMNEIKNQITEIVVMAAGAVAEKEISEADNTALIESFLVNADKSGGV